MLHVNEIFATIQGEATWTGTPSVFIRLQGCPVGCPWCDTKHTWPEGRERDRKPPGELLEKIDPAPSWAAMTPDRIVATAAGMGPRHFVLTGGEPLVQDVGELCRLLLELGTVQIETSGTIERSVPADVWLTVSPKVGMPGGLQVQPSMLAEADEVKMPVGSAADLEHLDELLELGQVSGEVWLQPLSQDPTATELCVATCMARGWRLSIQTHKFAGLR
jgi:7-carboxy-7-deazaguanine synthase